MSGGLEPVDMRGGANVLRCFGDFVAARPGLPEMASVHVVWCYVSRAWSVRVQLGDSAADVDGWAAVLDDAVVTSEPKENDYLGRYVLHQVEGTMYGHPVRAWTHLPHGTDA